MGTESNDPMQRLVDEHRVIERVLTRLAAYGLAVRRGEAVDPEALPGFVAFLRGYADAIHHGKEEQLVFAALLRHGAPAELVPRLAAIRREHETARLLIGDLAAVAERGGPRSDRDRERLVQVIGDYTALLRRHIRDEDTAVFPATWAAMPGPLRRKVAKACAKFDAGHAEQAAELCALADRLVLV
ncbi:MAG TPA: hemerythrin domain-containing protein [Planctomycetota bacterium]|nr:hemerythrin domain-containing protein [Planctomycetota bacterium]